MYNPGDYVVVPGYGVCRIDSVGHPSLSPADVNVDYYTLSPLNEKCRIHIPCSASDGRMRPVIMKDKALALLGYTINASEYEKKQTEAETLSGCNQ